jgi:hypothetical protein
MINKKLFIKGINNDDAYQLLDTNEYLNAVNMRFTTSENGRVGRLENIEGNEAKGLEVLSGADITIGAYEDTQNRRLYFFNYNAAGDHGIYCYEADTDVVWPVLLNSQVTGGLNFSSFIHSAAIVGDMLYWTDGVNPPRRINVKAGLKLNTVSYPTSVLPYTTPIKQSVIGLIRPQPWAPLTTVNVTDAGYVNNFIKAMSVQFVYRFVYRDNEISTFSPMSKLENYSPLNAIDVTIPLTQTIEQDVIKIEVGVVYKLDGSVFIVKTFTNGFTAHNSGTALTFRYYGDTVGVAVAPSDAVKPFDSVPRTAKTLEVAKNRLFLGNTVDGYDDPTTTSLVISTATAGSATAQGQWYRIVYRQGSIIYTRYWLLINDISPNPGYYVPASQPTTPIPATDVAFGTLTYAGANINAIALYLSIPVSDIYQLAYYGPTVNVTGVTPVSIAGSLIFKTDATYRAGIVFYDEAGRKGGVITNDTIKAVTPDRTYGSLEFIKQINWSLNNNDNPTAQIPVWATHYSVVRTKCQRTSFFVQLKADAVEYIEKTVTTGEYGSRHNTYSPAYFGIAINAKSLFNNNLGYTYQEGDILKLYVSGGPTHILAVKDTYGEFIICDLKDIGATNSMLAIYEIYTPYMASALEPYYEVGETYKIDNPGEGHRKFSVISGSFRGDSYILQRTIPSTHLAEAMSPVDKYWKNWNTDIGRTNIIINSQSVNKPVTIYYSNVFLSGTKTNGLSTFEVLSQSSLPTDLGQINRLVLTSKVQYEGTVMLAIGEQETASLYIGEAQVFDNNGNSFLASTTGVIGNINVMKGSYGTINPESAYEWKGAVVFFDANKGSWVKYDVNGLFPISNNKMSKYFRKAGQDILNYLKSPTEYNYASTIPLRVLGGVDPYHEEFLCYMPKMYLNPKNTVLEDMELASASYNFTTVAPTLTRTPTSLAFTYTFGAGPSASQSFTFSGANLSINGTITITGATDFEVSKDNVAFSSSVTFPYTGTSAAGTVHVRMKSGRSVGSYNSQTIGISNGTTSNTLAVSGTVTASATPFMDASPAVLSGFTYEQGFGPSPTQTFNITASALSPASGNVTITPNSDFECSVTSSGTGFSTSPLTLAYTAGGTFAANTVWVRMKAGLSPASYSARTIGLSGGGATDSVQCNGIVTAAGTGPTIYRYIGSGYGNSSAESATMANTAPVSLFSDYDFSTFGVGAIVYLNALGSTRLTGYTNVFMNGANWDVNPANGVVIAYSSIQA